MKILMVNKFFYIKGGSETYYFSLKKLLEENGHTVIDFSMKNENNFESQYSKYFVEAVDYNNKMGFKDKVKSACNIIYSFEARKKFDKLVKETQPDIIHLNIFQHQLSPSILDVIKKYNIPTVYTAHDLKMLCLNYIMMTKGEICERCKGEKYYNCLKYRCVKNSLVKSTINMIEGYVHSFRKSYDVIDTIITPSLFYKNKFIEFGVAPERVIHIANSLEEEIPAVDKSEFETPYFLYFGRLSKEKGLFTLLEAAEQADIPLFIVGTGPCKEDLEKIIQQKNLNKVKMLGFKRGQELTNLVGNSSAVILPSEWYENGPYSAIESLRLGRPIIGANIGGIPELINGNGNIFHYGNSQELANILINFPKLNTDEHQTMCKNSIDLFMENHSNKKQYEKIYALYEKTIAEKK